MSGGQTTRRGVGNDPAAGGGDLPVGTELGRYVVLSEVGRGGVGAVFRAYDPELEREVAIKVMTAVSEDAAEQYAALLAEARALAKLRHPNVVGVYDVGDHRGRVWMAMELLEGVSLRAWLSDGPAMSARQRVLRESAVALMAAHTEDIVHGDFKPENVVVTDRAHVVDFGLAHGIGAGPTRSQCGRPVGTIRYLAPELYDGVAPDRASDIYAFCVTAWEVLFDAPPWPNQDEDSLIEAKLEVPRTPSQRGVSRELSNLLRAGLTPDPTGRPDSLEPLVVALEPRHGSAHAAVVVVAVGAGAIVWAASGSVDCAPQADLSPFDASSMARLQSAFESASGGTAGWEPLRRNIDGFAQEYARQYRRACEATHDRGVQSTAELDARIDCLDRRREQLAVLLNRLDPGQEGGLQATPRAVARLGEQLTCDRPTPPSSPVEAAFVVALDEIEVLELLSRFDDAWAKSETLEQDAARIGARSAELWARYRRGRLMHLRDDPKAASDFLAQVHWDAEAADLPELAATAGLYVLYMQAAVFHDADETHRWAPHVASSIRLAGDDVLHRATLVENIGVAMLYEHRVEEALDQFETSLALRESVDGDAELSIVSSLGNIGIALEELHRTDEAIARQKRALEIVERRMGTLSPHTARVLDNLGTATLRAGDVEAGLELFERALEARLQLFGRAHRSTALSHTHIGVAHVMSDRPGPGIEQLQRAREILEPLEETGSVLDSVYGGLAHAHAMREEWGPAADYARRALELLPETMGEDHPQRVGLRDIIATADRTLADAR